MVKFILSCILFFVFNSAFAQDNIIFRNGDDVKGKVLEVTDELVKFKSADNPDGPVYSYKKSEIFFIKYENGKKDIFKEQQNTVPDSKPVYSTPRHERRNNPEGSVFSFILRTGYEYSHEHESPVSYYNQYGRYFAQTDNSFYLDILAGKRMKHYQYGAGLGFYFKDVRVHDSYYNDYNMTWYDIHTEFSGIGLAMFYSNRIFLLDKKFSPFMLADFNLAFDNVFRLKEENSYYNYSGYNYNDRNINPLAYITLGAGVEMKTSKKYKLQLELGVKLKMESVDTDNQSLLHTGLSFVF